MSSDRIFLAQTDTTVGFLSQDPNKLAAIKERPSGKPFLIEVESFAILKAKARVPKRFRSFVRRSKKSTFIYPNGVAIRVVREGLHRRFLQKFGWLYSTSANRSGERYERAFALDVADVVVEDRRGIFEGTPSRILRIGRKQMRKIR